MHILWDFSGTLANCGPIMPSVFDEFAGSLGSSEREEAWLVWQASFPWIQHTNPHAKLFGNQLYYDYLAASFNNAVCRFGTARNLSGEELRGAMLARLRYVLADGARTALEYVSDSGHTNHLASNHVPDLPDFLSRLKLRDFFQHMFISGIVGYEKPCSEFWLTIENTINMEPAQLVMIGDDWFRDIEPSSARGFHAVWIASGERRVQQMEPLPRTYTVNSITMVPSKLNEIMTSL